MARITVVCTGNINRSPFAAALLARAAPMHSVASAGLAADGLRTPERMVQAAAAFAVDLAAHSSRLLTEDDVETSDLILCMDRSHPLRIAAVSDVATRICFTLGEAVERLARIEGSLRDRIERAAAERPVAEFLSPPFPEIADPMGRSRRTHRKIARDIARTIEELAPRLAD